MQRADKILLRVNAAQVEHFKKSTDVSRYAFNWCKHISDEYRKLSGYVMPDEAVSSVWNSCRRISKPWTYDVSKYAGESGVMAFLDARSRNFEDLKERKRNPKHKIKFGPPKFKTKRRSKQSYTIRHPGHAEQNIRVDGDQLKLTKLDSVIRMARPIRFPGKIKSVTISETGGKWFASFQIEISDAYVYPHRCENQATVGIDMGLKAHVTLFSEGVDTKWDNPKFYRRFKRKLKKQHRALSRKQKGSRNREKACQALAKTYTRERNCRHNHLHHMTSQIVCENRFIGLETLGIANMMKNPRLARAIADASWGEFKRQILYKAEWGGSHTILAKMFFASSKLCSTDGCDYKNDALELSDRDWTCPKCGVRHDRDVNAARNLEKLARGLRERINACVTAPSEKKPKLTKWQRIRSKSRASKDAKAAEKIQECSSNSVKAEL